MALSHSAAKAASVATLLFSLAVTAPAQTKGIDPALLAKAKAGEASAEYRVAVAYEKLGNPKESHRWLLTAAKNDNTLSMTIVAIDYELGRNVQQDFIQASEWFRKAAERGDELAQTSLGSLYFGGHGVPQDNSQAAFWWHKAADQGAVDAEFDLAHLYDTGQGVPQDFTQAVAWYSKAAEQGNIDAQHMLAQKFLDGQGVQQDVKGAMAWFQKAAEQGDAESQYMLGQLYEDGGYGKLVRDSGGVERLAPPEGDNAIPKDYSSAVLWYRKAAEQGNTDAQSHLGRLYEDGTGVPQDYNEAYFWANLAAATGSSLYGGKLSEYLTADRDRIAAHLTRTDLARVQERTTKWFATHQPKAQ
jgi:TPR repeat protein